MLFGLAYACGSLVEGVARACGAKDGARAMGAVVATFVGAADPIGGLLYCVKVSSIDEAAAAGDPDAAKVSAAIGAVMAVGGVASGVRKLDT